MINSHLLSGVWPEDDELLVPLLELCGALHVLDEDGRLLAVTDLVREVEALVLADELVPLVHRLVPAQATLNL